jgi:hypothetical protein
LPLPADTLGAWSGRAGQLPDAAGEPSQPLTARTARAAAANSGQPDPLRRGDDHDLHSAHQPSRSIWHADRWLADVHGGHGRCGCCLGAGRDGVAAPEPIRLGAPARPSISPQPSSSPVPAPRPRGFCWTGAATPPSRRHRAARGPSPSTSTTAGLSSAATKPAAASRRFCETRTAASAPSESPAPSPWAVGINDRSQVVGVYATDLATGTTRGFLLDNGRYTTFAAPGVLVTFPYGINNRGQIAGFTLTGYDEPFQGARGFLLARGVRGPFTPVDFPGAPRTLVGGLNDRGQLVGTYENPDTTPSP